MPEAVLARQICLLTDDPQLDEWLAGLSSAHRATFQRVGSSDVGNLGGGSGLLLLDLDLGEETARSAIETARRIVPTTWYICAYGSRLDYETLAMVRAWGADRVVSRSRLLVGLQNLLAELFGAEDSETS
jgi:hypothetical protein